MEPTRKDWDIDRFKTEQDLVTEKEMQAMWNDIKDKIVASQWNAPIVVDKFEPPAVISGFFAYQQQAHTTAEYPEDKALEYLTLGLMGEAGEFANKVKKVLRGDFNEQIYQDELSVELRESFGMELMDVLWYLAELCTVLDLDLSEMAQKNLEKLADRKARGVIKGSGDER